MRHLRAILIVFSILTLATLACGLNLGRTKPPSGDAATPPIPVTEAPPTKTPPPTIAVTPTPQPAETPVDEAAQPSAIETMPVATESVEGETEKIELDLGTSVSGLKDLNSYRATFRFDWSGIKEGQPVSGFMEMQSAFVREPPAQELYFEGQGFEGEEKQGLGKIAFIQVGNTAWFYEGESDTWMQVPAGSLDFAEGLFFQPEDLLKNFDISKGRRSTVPKEVNGVPCYAYTFDENDFDLSDASEGDTVVRADGEVCVAVDGGHVVRLVIDADFRYTDPGQVFEEGNVKINFDIWDVNQPITIEPPAEAKAKVGGRTDIPVLPDADVEFASTELISYRTFSSVADAAKFYQDEMSRNGWKADEGNMIFDQNALLHYNKANETADVIIGSDVNGTNVLITIGGN
jgi:hypothetical protein